MTFIQASFLTHLRYMRIHERKHELLLQLTLSFYLTMQNCLVNINGTNMLGCLIMILVTPYIDGVFG